VGEPFETGSPASALLIMDALYEDMSSMLEKDIERDAAAAGITMRGLETAVYQDKLLEKLLDLRMLRAAIEQTKSRAEIDKDSRDDLTEYCAGTDDSPGIEPAMRAQMKAAGYADHEL